MLLLNLILLQFAHYALAGKVLVTYAPDSKSHLRSILPVINSLANAGHNVSVFYISSEKNAERFATNVSLIEVPIHKPNLENFNMSKMIWENNFHSYGIFFVYKMLTSLFNDNVAAKKSEKFVEVFNTDWDLIVTSVLFNPPGYLFAQTFCSSRHNKVPCITASTTMMFPSDAYKNSLGHSWVVHPPVFGTGPVSPKDKFNPKSFVNRLINIFETTIELITFSAVEALVLSPIKFLGYPQRFSFYEFNANSEIAFVDSIDTLAFPMPTARDVVNVGATCDIPRTLPQEYLSFIEDPDSKGTIYIAFGTAVPWDTAPTEKADALFDAFDQLPEYRFVFSWKGKLPQHRTIPKHVKMVAWAPQFDLLSHPRTRVFLTHSGLKSIKESLCSRTPILSLPMFAEQAHNAKMVLAFGAGITLNKYTLNSEEVYNGLKELLDNDKYVKRVTKLRDIYLDRPIGSLDEGTFFASRLMRIKNKSYGKNGTSGGTTSVTNTRLVFKRKGSELSEFQSFYLDLIITLIGISFVLTRK